MAAVVCGGAAHSTTAATAPKAAFLVIGDEILQVCVYQMFRVRWMGLLIRQGVRFAGDDLVKRMLWHSFVHECV